MTFSPVMPDTDTSYSVSTPHTWPHDVMPGPKTSCPAPTGHHSFFNALAGLVRAAREIWMKTAAREIRSARMMASA